MNKLLSNRPTIMWGYLCKLCTFISHVTKRNSPCSRALAEKRLGDTSDMSEYVQFNWYQYIWYINPADPLNKKNQHTILCSTQHWGQDDLGGFYQPRAVLFHVAQ